MNGTLVLFEIELGLELNDLVGERGDEQDFVPGDCYFPLGVVQLEIDHADVVADLLDLLLALLEHAGLDVVLFVQDAEFVVAVDQLHARVVAVFAGHFVLLPQLEHLLLQREDHHVLLLDLADVLIHQLVRLFRLVLSIKGIFYL